MTKRFYVDTVSFSREYLENYGYDTSRVSDDTMQDMVDAMSEKVFGDVGYLLAYGANEASIPRKKTRAPKK